MAKSVWSYTNGKTGAADTAAHTMKAADPGVSINKTYLSGIQLRALANAGTVEIKSGATVLYADSLAIAEARVVPLEEPIHANSGDDLTVTCSATGIIVNAQGFVE